MSLKSFDDFCAKMVNNDPIEQKDIFDERQTLIRSRITTRALWVFAYSVFFNILIMECGPQWCESYVLSTAVFAAIALLYWTAANARQDTLFGINGTMSAATQGWLFFFDGLFVPYSFISHSEYLTPSTFFIKDGMVTEQLTAVIAGALLIVSAVIMIVSYSKFRKQKKNEESGRRKA